MKKKVKGFTLIELIVVMAIFGIIMAAAMQILPLVTKMMVQADVHEGGNAAATGVSNYIKGELQGVEYISVYNKVPAEFSVSGGSVTYNVDTTTLQNWVNRFVNEHYSAIIKNDTSATPTSFQWAKGNPIHVMLIDNAEYKDAGGNVLEYGMIRSATYTYDFEQTPSATNTTPFTVAVNRAYYDSYPMEIKLGEFADVSAFTSAGAENYDKLAAAVNNRNTVFSILTKVSRKDTDYSFLTQCGLSLVNIENRNTLYLSSVPKDTYYTVVTDTSVTPNTSSFVDVNTLAGVDGKYKEAVQLFPAATSGDADYYSGGHNGYCIIYSYTSEINN